VQVTPSAVGVQYAGKTDIAKIRSKNKVPSMLVESLQILN
jgi:hypothetical protein